MWDLPLSVEINGEKQLIRNKCDYRVVLDVISALNDNDLTDDEKIQCALYIFYEDISTIDDFETAVNEMFKIINGGDSEKESKSNKPRLMDWEHDFQIIAPPINRVLSTEIRSAEYVHWFTFLGAYMEIGECTFSTVVSIREKKQKGKKLDKWEVDYIREHREMVELPKKLTVEEQELLNSEW